MPAGIPEQDVHSEPEMLFQLRPSLWVCHLLFRRAAVCILCFCRRGSLIFVFMSCSLTTEGQKEMLFIVFFLGCLWH